MKIIDVKASKGQQSVSYTEVVEAGKYRLRISIKSDSYDFQSHAFIEVWKVQDLHWSKVHTIHFKQMLTEHGLVYKVSDDISATHFQADRDELIRVAKAVLKIR